MANVRWSDGSIGSIGQAILRSDKYYTNGEMTLLQSAIGSTVLKKEVCKHDKCQVVRWIDRIHQTSNLTDGEIFYGWRNDVIAKCYRQYSLKARGFASMANVRWSDGSIGSIGQAILRSDKYFTDGEMT